MEYNTNLWYGQYGGCFIADAFTPDCDRYEEQFRQAAEDAAFQADLAALRRRFFPGPARCVKDEACRAVLCYAPENYEPVFGTALLAKYLGKRAVCGARYADEALMVARVCASLGVDLRLFLAHELGAIRTLTDQLSLLGADYDTEMCEQLFDLPEMYAFQAWVSQPDQWQIVNCRSNVGAFPQTNVAAAFAAAYGGELVAGAEREFGPIDRVVVPAVSGSLALSVLQGSGKDCVCVECDTERDLTEELDSYCGAFTKVMRNRTADRVLAPELMDLADRGRALRVRIPPEEAIKAESARNLSLQSLAAMRYCAAHPAEGTTLCIVREIRWGSPV